MGERTVAATPYALGDTQTFQLDDKVLTAQLMGVTEHFYFWMEEGLDWDSAEIQAVADQVENDLLPPLLAFLAVPWPVGIDNDPHVTILHLASTDPEDELGFFDSMHQYPRTIVDVSNEQEMIFMNMRALRLGGELYLATLLHELEHLLHWLLDANEAVWLDEGLAQLTELHAGFHTAGADDYLQEPATALNAWEYDEDAIYAHYAAAYLFMTYFWEQLGDEAIPALLQQPADGLAGVRAALAEQRPGMTLEQFFADWTVANLLNDPLADPRYGYRHLRLGLPSFAARVKSPSFDFENRLAPFGVDYIAIHSAASLTLTLTAEATADLLPLTPRSGDKVWLALAADESDVQLTQALDLTGLSAATLQFWAWYDLEKGYDFAYVLVSADQGVTWELLRPQHARAGEFGLAFSGRSRDARDDVDGWVQERLSLNAYANRPILLRFEVLTDASTTRGGFALDDISLPELNYFDGAETIPDDRQSGGFVATGLTLPQPWLAQLVIHSDPPVVYPLALDALNQGTWTFQLDDQPATLIISPLNPFVPQPAAYQLHLTTSPTGGLSQ